MSKSAVYSWRMTPDLKARLERRARNEGVSLAELLDSLASSWLAASTSSADADLAEQEALHAAASSVIGAIHGGNSRRAAEARDAVRRRLNRKRRAS